MCNHFLSPVAKDSHEVCVRCCGQVCSIDIYFQLCISGLMRNGKRFSLAVQEEEVEAGFVEVFRFLWLFEPHQIPITILELSPSGIYKTHLISKIQGYLLVKFLSRISKIYVDPRGIAWGVPP